MKTRQRLRSPVLIRALVCGMVLAWMIIWVASPSWPASAQGGSPPIQNSSTADHSKFEVLQQDFQTGPEVTKACLSCHTEAAKQVMQTPHWTWEFVDPDTGKVMGKRHDINNYCVAVTSNWPRCTSCHIGYGFKDESFDFAAEENVDCLVCHDTTGTYKKFPAGAGHPAYEPKEFPPGSGNIWNPPDLKTIAQQVGPTSRATCGACHFYGGGGDMVKHGDLDSSLIEPPFELDVHMSPEGANMTCSSCHYAGSHQITGSRYKGHPKDTHGKDLPETDFFPTTCESCHDVAPHDDGKLNDHVDKVACQACHIPAFARLRPTKLSWDWSKAGDKQRKVEKATVNGVEVDVYHFKKGEFTWQANVQPVYRWYNGNNPMMVMGEVIDPGQAVYINQPQGSADDPNARIYPFKEFKGIQGYDPVNKVLLVPHLMPTSKNDTAAYWKGFDWAAAFEAGMQAAGLEYSGQYDWIETTMVWPITHMVAPKEQAVACQECHTRQNSRLAGIEGVYLPARDHFTGLDLFGWGLSLLALVGVVIHGGARVVARNK